MLPGSAALLLLLAVAPSAGQTGEASPDAAPRATSGEIASDAVGYATLMTPLPEGPFRSVMIAVAHPTLQSGSFVEVTALDTGRTIAAQVVSGTVENAVVALSPGAAIGDRRSRAGARACRDSPSR